jgi:hypothetical protein
MDRSMTGRGVVGAIPTLLAAGLRVASLGVVLAVPPSRKSALLAAPAVVVSIQGRAMAPSPQG